MLQRNAFQRQWLILRHQPRSQQCLFYHSPSPTLSADTLALLLTDVLVFLQEKDQRLIFAAVVCRFGQSRYITLHSLFHYLVPYLQLDYIPKKSPKK
jgi:hypothetical protein